MKTDILLWFTCLLHHLVKSYVSSSHQARYIGRTKQSLIFFLTSHCSLLVLSVYLLRLSNSECKPNNSLSLQLPSPVSLKPKVSLDSTEVSCQQWRVKFLSPVYNSLSTSTLSAPILRVRDVALNLSKRRYAVPLPVALRLPSLLLWTFAKLELCFHTRYV